MKPCLIYILLSLIIERQERTIKITSLSLIDNEKEFSYVGCSDKETLEKLRKAIGTAIELLDKKNNGKYIIVNDIKIPDMDVQ